MIELSSWQLEGLGEHELSPHIAVFTNISPDHLNRYASMETYLDAKLNISRYQSDADWFIVNADDPTVWEHRDEGHGMPVAFSYRDAGHQGAFVEDGTLFWRYGNEDLELIPEKELALRGRHNVMNALAASAAALLAGASPDNVRDGLRMAGGVPDRQEIVAELDGALFVNDTTATTPAAVYAALERFGNHPARLDRGGFGKRCGAGGDGSDSRFFGTHRVVARRGGDRSVADLAGSCWRSGRAWAVRLDGASGRGGASSGRAWRSRPPVTGVRQLRHVWRRISSWSSISRQREPCTHPSHRRGEAMIAVARGFGESMVSAVVGGRSRARSLSHEPDYWLIAVILTLVMFGLVMVFSASMAIGIQQEGNSYYFLTRQAIWAVIGFSGMLVTTFVDYHFWRRLSLPGMLVIMLMLAALVFVPGLGVGGDSWGANRWIPLGPLSFQPSEVAKLVLVIYLADWLGQKGQKIRNFSYGLIPFALFLGLLIGLVMLQPDLGTATLMAAIGISMFLVAGADLFQLGALIGLGSISFLALALGASYRRARILIFLNPDSDPRNTGYQLVQSRLALGSGGLFGLGLGASREKFTWLPAAQNDAIFAVIGEELGPDWLCLRPPPLRAARLAWISHRHEGARFVWFPRRGRYRHLDHLPGSGEHWWNHADGSVHRRATSVHQLWRYRAGSLAYRHRHTAEHFPPDCRTHADAGDRGGGTSSLSASHAPGASDATCATAIRACSAEPHASTIWHDPWTHVDDVFAQLKKPQARPAQVRSDAPTGVR